MQLECWQLQKGLHAALRGPLFVLAGAQGGVRSKAINMWHQVLPKQLAGRLRELLSSPFEGGDALVRPDSGLCAPANCQFHDCTPDMLTPSSLPPQSRFTGSHCSAYGMAAVAVAAPVPLKAGCCLAMPGECLPPACGRQTTLDQRFRILFQVLQRDMIEGGWVQQATAICLRLVQELKGDYQKKIFERCLVSCMMCQLLGIMSVQYVLLILLNLLSSA